MANLRSALKSAALVAVFVGAATITGCGGVSEEQLKELEALRAEVKTLDKEVNGLKSEKAKLEKEIADREAQLDQCNKEKNITKQNLEKIGK